MTRRSGSLLAALVTVLGVGVAGCSEPATTLDAAATERTVEQVVADRIEPEVSEVRCPDRIERGVGVEVRCRAILASAAGSVRLQVSQVDEDASLEVELADAVLDVDTVAEDLTASLVDELARPVRVDCGDREVLVVEPGSDISCTATDERGDREVAVTVSDARGTLRYELGAAG